MTMQTALDIDKAVAELFLKFLFPYKQFMMWSEYDTRKTQVTVTVQIVHDLAVLLHRSQII